MPNNRATEEHHNTKAKQSITLVAIMNLDWQHKELSMVQQAHEMVGHKGQRGIWCWAW